MPIAIGHTLQTFSEARDAFIGGESVIDASGFLRVLADIVQEEIHVEIHGHEIRHGS